MSVHSSTDQRPAAVNADGHRKGLARLSACLNPFRLSIRSRPRPSSQPLSSLPTLSTGPDPELKSASKVQVVELPTSTSSRTSMQHLDLDTDEVLTETSPRPSTEASSDLPAAALNKESGPTFLSLYPELHLMISEYLDPPSLHVLSFTPNTRLSKLYASPGPLSASDRAMATELLTRDKFERTMLAHIDRYGCFEKKHLMPDEKEILRETTLYCHVCDQDVPVTHFTPKELKKSFSREGYAKSRERQCIPSKWYVKAQPWHETWYLEWPEIQKAKDELLALETEDPDQDNEGSATGNSAPGNPPGIPAPGHALPADDIVTRDLFPDVRGVKQQNTSRGKSKKAKNVYKQARPRDFVHLHRRLFTPLLPGRTPDFAFEADIQYARELMYGWGPKLRDNITWILWGLFCDTPYFCPHMRRNVLKAPFQVGTVFDGTLLDYMVTSLHAEDGLAWVDADWDGPDVVKQTKSISTECSECRTEIILQRAKFRAKPAKAKWWGNRAEKWVDCTYVIVRKKFEVSTPSGGQWRSQVVQSERGWGSEWGSLH